MREPFKSNFKTKLQTEFKPNDKSFGPTYNSMMNVLIDELFKRVELMDVMEVDGVKEEIDQIQFIDVLIGDIRKFKIGDRMTYPMIIDSKKVNLVFKIEKG